MNEIDEGVIDGECRSIQPSSIYLEYMNRRDVMLSMAKM